MFILSVLLVAQVHCLMSSVRQNFTIINSKDLPSETLNHSITLELWADRTIKVVKNKTENATTKAERRLNSAAADGPPVEYSYRLNGILYVDNYDI